MNDVRVFGKTKEEEEEEEEEEEINKEREKNNKNKKKFRSQYLYNIIKKNLFNCKMKERRENI